MWAGKGEGQRMRESNVNSHSTGRCKRELHEAVGIMSSDLVRQISEKDLDMMDETGEGR